MIIMSLGCRYIIIFTCLSICIIYNYYFGYGYTSIKLLKLISIDIYPKHSSTESCVESCYGSEPYQCSTICTNNSKYNFCIKENYGYNNITNICSINSNCYDYKSEAIEEKNLYDFNKIYKIYFYNSDIIKCTEESDKIMYVNNFMLCLIILLFICCFPLIYIICIMLFSQFDKNMNYAYVDIEANNN